MPLLIVLLGVILLVFMIVKLKLNTFVSLVVTSFVIALLLQIPVAKITTTIETGIGGQCSVSSFPIPVVVTGSRRL